MTVSDIRIHLPRNGTVVCIGRTPRVLKMILIFKPTLPMFVLAFHLIFYTKQTINYDRFQTSPLKPLVDIERTRIAYLCAILFCW